MNQQNQTADLSHKRELKADLPETILQIIAANPQGISIQKISEKISFQHSRRTLQRRLGDLVKIQRLMHTGKNKGLKYYIYSESSSETSLESIEKIEIKSKPSTFSRSRESSKIKLYLEQTLHTRRPVTYNRAFLNTYCPNQTPYLSKQICDYLHKIAAPLGKQRAAHLAQKMLPLLSLDLSWNSCRLSGNTYSEQDTKNLIEEACPAKDKGAFDAQMILNHHSAIQFLAESAKDGYSRPILLNLHGILSDNLLKDPASSGRLRKTILKISKSAYQPLTEPKLIEEYFSKILEKLNKIEDPFEQAFFALVHFSYLQAFEEENLSFARLAANIPLFKNNCCPLLYINLDNTDFEEAILGIFELNQVDLMRELFIYSMEASVAHYSEILHSRFEPDPIKMRFSNEIKRLFQEIFQGRHLKGAALSTLIQGFATQYIPRDAQKAFIEIVEKELKTLHPGNLARYQIPLNEFECWAETAV